MRFQKAWHLVESPREGIPQQRNQGRSLEDHRCRVFHPSRGLQEEDEVPCIILQAGEDKNNQE